MGLTLLKAARDGHPIAQIGAELSEQLGAKVTAADVLEWHTRLTAQLNERLGSLSTPSHPYRTVTIFGHQAVAAAARPLTVLFRPPVVVASLAVIVGGISLAAARGIHPAGRFGLVVGFGFFLVTVMVHELGHASAVQYHGGVPGPIGVTLSSIWPSFHADVTDARGFPRLKRIAVDLAGVYFQLTVVGCYGLIYAVTGLEVFATAIIISLVTGCLCLTPILGSDGCLVLADLLGVRQILRSAWLESARLLPGPARRHLLGSAPLQTGTTTRLALLAYSALICALCAACVIFLATGQCWRQALLLPSAIDRLVNEDASAADLVTVLLAFLTASIIVGNLQNLVRSLFTRPTFTRPTFTRTTFTRTTR